MAEVKINGTRFQLGKLNAKDQFHVFRRVAPIMAGLGEGFAKLPAGDMGDMSEGQLVQALGPLADVLADMDDAQCDYIINKCLHQVRMFNGQTWAPVMVAGQLMFDLIDMNLMLRLTIAMMQENGVINFSGGDPDPASIEVPQ